MLCVDMLPLILSNSAKCHGPRSRDEETETQSRRDMLGATRQVFGGAGLERKPLDPRLQASSLS